MKFYFIILSLLIAYNSYGQLKLSDTTQFRLIYNDKVTKDVDNHRYDFFGDYVIRQTKGKLTQNLFGEEVIQIGDVSEQVLYNYFVRSEKLAIVNPEMAEWARDILQRKDTIINENELLHFTVFESRWKFSSITELFYLKNVVLPQKYRDISALYAGKNGLFRPENHHILYKVISESSDGKKLSDMQLIEISESEFDEDKIQKLISTKN